MSLVLMTCQRCPQVFKHWSGKRIQPLCEDCRYVLSASERAIYEAA